MGKNKFFLERVKGEILQKSVEATELDPHSLMNNCSSLKKELHEKYKFGLNST